MALTLKEYFEDAAIESVEGHHMIYDRDDHLLYDGQAGGYASLPDEALDREIFTIWPGASYSGTACIILVLDD